MTKKIDSKQDKTNHIDTDVQASRRKVLRNTLVGGAVIGASAAPEKWSKPVLDSVVLPTHATTTDDTGELPGGATTAAATTVSPTTSSPTTTASPTTLPPLTTRPPLTTFPPITTTPFPDAR